MCPFRIGSGSGFAAALLLGRRFIEVIIRQSFTRNCLQVLQFLPSLPSILRRRTVFAAWAVVLSPNWTMRFIITGVSDINRFQVSTFIGISLRSRGRKKGSWNEEGKGDFNKLLAPIKSGNILNGVGIEHLLQHFFPPPLSLSFFNQSTEEMRIP